MPKNQRYTGTAVIERSSVPIRNELTSQSTRRKGICGNMVLVDYSAGQIYKSAKEWLLWRDLVVAADVTNSPNFVAISHIILDV